MPNVQPIELDGSTLEGGGQLVRVALSLSAITGIPVHIYNIRANRAPQGRSKQAVSAQSRGDRSKHTARVSNMKVEGGLKESHLAAAVYLARMCDAYVEGLELGSREIMFIPGAKLGRRKHAEAVQGNTHVDFETNTIELQKPGSVWLMLQAILPFFVFGKLTASTGPQKQQPASTRSKNSASQAAGFDDFIELTLKGGTNVSKSMSGEYVQHVLLPTLHRIGLPKIECEVKERGWAGNASRIGEVRVRVPRPPAGGFILPPFEVKDRGEIEKITFHTISGDEDSRMKLEQGLRGVVAEHFGSDLPVDITESEASGDPRRLYVLLVGQTKNGWRLGRDFLGSGRTPRNDAERMRVIQQVCQTVVREMKNELGGDGCVDEYLQDQLVLFQALASGTSIVEGDARANPKIGGDREYGDGGGSLHTRTVRWVCETMLSKQGIEFEPGGKCRGIGCGSPSDDGVTKKLAISPSNKHEERIMETGR